MQQIPWTIRKENKKQKTNRKGSLTNFRSAKASQNFKKTRRSKFLSTNEK